MHRPNQPLFSRRQILEKSIPLSVLLPIISSGSMIAISSALSSGLALEPLSRPVPGQLRLSLAAYSMRKYLEKDKATGKSAMDLFEFVDWAKSLGLAGVELTSYYFHDTSNDYLVSLRRHCHHRGITITGGAIRNDFCQLDEVKLEKDRVHTKEWIDRYALLGANVIRIFAGNLPKDASLQETMTRCANECEKLCEYASSRGVMLALENHHGVTATAEGLLQIVRQVRSSAFGINFDSGNFKMTADPYAELEMIAPYAVNSQIKVDIFQNGKQEPTDLKRVLQILRNAGYSGWVALEYEAEEEPNKAIPKCIAELQTMMG